MLSTNPAQIALEASLNALIQQFNKGKDTEAIEAGLFSIIFNPGLDFLIRSKNLDAWISEHKDHEELSDILFDLLMTQFLSAETHPEDYFDTPEWEEIENKTLNKGSEILNLYLYLSEAKESEVEISLDDFLKEFLLVGEDEFQDEYRIYESLIVNEDIMDADIDTIRIIQNKIKPDNDLKDYFVSLVLFFQFMETELEIDDLMPDLNNFEAAVLVSLIAYNEN